MNERSRHQFRAECGARSRERSAERGARSAELVWSSAFGVPRSILRAARSAFSFNSHTDSTGTKVLDRTYEVTIEKPTARLIGTNSSRAAPCMKNAGMKTARM